MRKNKRISQSLLLGLFFVATICYGKHFLQKHLFNEVAFAEESAPKENVLLQSKLKKGITMLDVPFIENQGQLSEENVRFYANLLDGKILLKDQAIEYVFSEKKINEEEELEEDSIPVNFQEVFLGTNNEELNLNFSGEEEFSGPITLFSKQSEGSISRQLSAFNKVTLGEIWPGIEVNLQARGSNVEKIFQVAPDANIEDIQLKFKEGWETSLDEKGKLILTKAEQTIKFTAPFAFQEIKGEKREVLVEYSLKNDGYGFQVTGDYDPDYSLTIDPLLASTMIFNNSQSESYLYGGESNAIAIDPEGNVFIAGGDGDNAKIFKLTPDLSQLLGQASLPLSSSGSGEDIEDLKIDDNGDIYAVINYTYSDSFPTVNAYQSTRAGSSDAFVAKFNNDLSALLSATYLGGTSSDFGHSLELTDSSVYISGRTRSSNFPVTDGSSNSGNYDGFLTKLTKDLSILESSTYLGGSDSDQINSLYIDSLGKVFITGNTRSSNFPTTSGAFQENYKSSTDVFVVRLSEDFSSLEASTFLGGFDSYEYGQEILINEDTGKAVLTGYTRSSDFPTTTGSFNESINGSSDGFISVFNYDLTDLEHSTYVGGSSSDGIDSLTLDSQGNIYTVGTTYSDDIPLAPEPTILETLKEEDFEEATFPPSGWGSWGDESWIQDGSYSQQGSFSAASGNIGSYDESYLVTEVDFQENAGLVEFYWKVSSEAGYGNDELFFHIDDTEIARISGDQNWQKVTANVSAGSHTFTWTYDKDGSVSSGEDRGWIDNIKFFSTEDPGNISYNQGEDVFWTQFSPDLTTLNYSSYIGGTREDSGHGIALDELGNVFLTGEAYGSTPTAGDEGTNDFPTTSGSFSPEGIVETDIFLVKFQSLISHLVVRDAEQSNTTSIQKSDPQTINIIAENNEGNTLEDYQGSKEIVLSLDKDATGDGGEVPTCNGVEIDGTNVLNLEFSQGVASCELEIHKLEEDSPFQLDASDGEIDSHGQNSWDLDISVYEESSPPASDSSCDYFQTTTDDDQLVFEVCIEPKQKKEIEEIEENEDTGIIRAKIESEDDEEVQGEFTVEEHSSPPSKLTLPSEYQDSSYEVYKYLEVDEDLEEDKEGVEEITFYLEISNQ